MLDELVDDWDAVFGRAGSLETFHVAGAGVQVGSSNPALGTKLLRSMAHLRDDDHPSPSLQVVVSDGREQAIDPYRVFDRSANNSDRPVVIHGREWRARFDPRDAILNVLDRTGGRALFWIQEPSSLPYWEEKAPLRHTFNWWFEPEGFRIVHAGGVGTPSGGALIVGGAGSGKSTVALSCLGTHLRCTGDDYQLVQTNGVPHTFSLYSCVQLRRDNIVRVPRLAGSEEIIGEKARFYLGELFPDALIPGFPIRVVLVPKVADGKSRLVPISAGRALTALAPSSIMQLHAVQGDPLGAMAGIVSKAKTFCLQLGRDVENIPSLVQEALG